LLHAEIWSKYFKFALRQFQSKVEQIICHPTIVGTFFSFNSTMAVLQRSATLAVVTKHLSVRLFAWKLSQKQSQKSGNECGSNGIEQTAATKKTTNDDKNRNGIAAQYTIVSNL